MKRLKIVKNVLFFNETSENYGKRLCHRRDFSTFPCMLISRHMFEDNKYNKLPNLPFYSAICML